MNTAVDFDNFTPPTPYQAFGGSKAIQQIVDRFYDLMENDPAFEELRAKHAEDLEPMRASLTGWMKGWFGGPRDWFDANPGKCMIKMLSAAGIGRDTAGQWADAMTRAMREFAPNNPEMRQALAERFHLVAKSMAMSSPN